MLINKEDIHFLQKPASLEIFFSKEWEVLDLIGHDSEQALLKSHHCRDENWRVIDSAI